MFFGAHVFSTGQSSAQLNNNSRHFQEQEYIELRPYVMPDVPVGDADSCHVALTLLLSRSRRSGVRAKSASKWESGAGSCVVVA